VQRTATIIAKTDCELAVMEKENYQNIIGKIEAQKILKKISFISKFPFLEGWSFREIKTLSYHFEEVKVSFNDIIFKQD
jgi:cAMP-dependent protein kinase regulator